MKEKDEIEIDKPAKKLIASVDQNDAWGICFDTRNKAAKASMHYH